MEYRTALTPTTDNGTKIISPIPNSTLTQSPTTFTWLGDAESTSYHIRLGSSHRGHDLVAATLGAQATEYTVDLPIDGDPIYVSIATFLPGGAYYYRDYVYQTSNTPRATGVHFYINDHLGTPQQLVNNDQAITWAADYDAFGAATVTTELVSNNHRFPGQYFDAESGLHYNWHRYYDPETGRYTRSDPIELVGGLNTFGYVGGNPLRYYDPNGKDFREVVESLWDAGPIDAFNGGNSMADQAGQDAQNSGLSGAHNGQQDAFRHCVWSCRMASGMPPSDAREIGENHEEAGNRAGQPPNEAAMDRFNNNEGIQCAALPPANVPSSCPKKCRSKLSSGGLQTFPNSSPKCNCLK